MRKTKGFTLIEVIVVVSIIAVLAAILIPLMMNYISKSKIASRNADAKHFHLKIQEKVFELNEEGYEIVAIVKGKGENTEVELISINQAYVSKDSETLEDVFSEVPKKFVTNNMNWAFYINDTETLAVVCSDSSMSYAGGYPNACPESSKKVRFRDKKIEDLLVYALKKDVLMKEKTNQPWPE